MTQSRLVAAQLQAANLGPIDLSLAAGECVCVSGPSGAGKTRLLRALADLDPHSGAVSLDGRTQDSVDPCSWRRSVALLLVNSGWWCATPRTHFAKSFDSSALARLALPAEVMDRPVADLSSGELQRLALLRVLQNRPTVLLLDEPTANLDPESCASVEALLIEYRDRHGACLLWISHDQNQANRVADRVLHMTGGRLAPPL